MRQLELVRKPDAAVHHRLGDHLLHIGGDHRVRQVGLAQVVHVLRDVGLQTVVEEHIAPHDVATPVHHGVIEGSDRTLVNGVGRGFVVLTLLVEPSISEPALLFFKVHGIDRDELEVQDLDHVFIIPKLVALQVVVVPGLTHLGLVVPVLLGSLLCDDFVLLFSELIARDALQFVYRDALYVTSVNQVTEVRVFGIAMHELCRIDIAGFDSLVGVVVSFDNCHTQRCEVINTTPVG